MGGLQFTLRRAKGGVNVARPLRLIRFMRQSGIGECIGRFRQGFLSSGDMLSCCVCSGGGLRFLFGEAVMVVVDRGQRAEEKAADVGEDGGAAGRDASFGEEIVESAEGVIDALRILEFGCLTGEGLANI
jgi:hypothetical protein